MSQRQVLTLLDALLKDPAEGLAVTVDRLSGAMGDGATVTSDFSFGSWALPGQAMPATRGNIMLRPTSWRVQPIYVGRQRDGECGIEISFETFSADLHDITSEVTLVATALVQVLDQMRGFSDLMVASYGTVVDLVENTFYEFSFGEFAGPTSSGFVCRFTVYERSLSD